MKLKEGKKTELNILRDSIKKTPSRLWSVGKSTSKHLNTLNPKEDVEQEEKKRKRRKSGVDPTRFMTPSEIRKWNQLPERKKEQLMRKVRLAEEEKKSVNSLAGSNKNWVGNGTAARTSSRNNAVTVSGKSGYTNRNYEGRESVQGDSRGNTSAGKQENFGSPGKTVNSDRVENLGNMNRNPEEGHLSTIVDRGDVKRINKVGAGAEKGGNIKAAASVGKETVVSVGNVTTTTAASAATAGTAAVASAGKKVAKKFREKLRLDKMKEAERIRQTESDMRSKKEGAEGQSASSWSDSSSLQSSGISKKVEKLIAALVTVVTSFFGAIMSVLLYVIMIVFAIIIVLVILISLFSKTGGTGRQKMVEAALAEYEVSDQNIGGTKYKNWYGLDADWCGMFVSYCANQCGYISEGIIVKSASVSESMNWYKARDEFETKESGYVPMPGDIIFFTNGMSHMGIVIEYDENTDHVIVVEGNSGPSDTKPYHKGSHVKKAEYARTAAAISGYGTPAYPDQISELEGGTNAEKIFRGLVNQGYTEQAAAAVVGNIFREAGVDASGDIKLHSSNPSGSSIGIVQWTGGRKEAFLAYAEAAGEPWPETSLEVQLNYVLIELSSNQWMWTAIGNEYGADCNMSLAEFKSLTDTEYATRVFCAMFERCHLSNAALPYRTEKAKETYQKYAGT